MCSCCRARLKIFSRGQLSRGSKMFGWIKTSHEVESPVFGLRQVEMTAAQCDSGVCETGFQHFCKPEDARLHPSNTTSIIEFINGFFEL